MIAIYVRQSVDRKDSISIKTQIETCKNKILSSNTEKIEVFSDKGFSGKSAANRPEFQRMMSEVRSKNISKIIVYKLDRISRSLIDFITMREEFQKYNVELISCAEDFDTSTSTGKLMLNMLMMFAEMERETIQKRATDNFYARGEMGFYLSGRPPFGYKKVETTIQGKKTYMFEENEAESVILKQIFQDYSSGKSMGEISRWLNNDKILSKNKKPWSNNGVSRILRNPVYVKANADVYHYLVGLGAKMNNDIEEYTGENGCVVYGKPADRKGMKFSNLSTDFVTLGLHNGILDASLWLSVQYTINQKVNHSNLGFGSLTWLQGLIKCKCGYTMYVKKCVNRKHKNPIEYRYLYCKGDLYGTCQYYKKLIRSSKVEEVVEAEIMAHLTDLKNIQSNKAETDSPELNALKIQIAKIDEQIDGFVNQFSNLSDVTINYLDSAIKKLDAEKKALIDKINDIQLKANRSSEIDIDIDEVINAFSSYDLDTKKSVSKKIIEKIILDDEELNIIFY